MSLSPAADRVDFSALSKAQRGFVPTTRSLVGHIPTIAITPVADGRTGAYESNAAGTWRMAEKVHRLISRKVKLPDGTPVRVIVAPEIVYGPRTGALAQAAFVREGVSANIWVSRSWAYSDELMSACQGLGSSEWLQAAYGLNQTNRPGAVWLKAFCAAMDEKMRPIFSIYNPDLEAEDGDLPPYVAERILRFARCAAAAAEMRGKNYLSLGGVSMGIIGSDVRRNIMLNRFGMGTVSVDMVAIKGRIDQGFYDHEELERAFQFMKKNFTLDFGEGRRPYPPDDLLRWCILITMITRDLMVGNPKLADPRTGKAQGFRTDIERAQGCNAILAGTQGQRAWTDLYPNFDVAESILNSSFDWNGFRAPFLVATENDSKNGIGMLAANLLTGLPQLFADIRTNWTVESIKKATGKNISKIAPQGFIDKRNSGAGALDYALNVPGLVKGSRNMSMQDVAESIRSDPALQKLLMTTAMKRTTYMRAALEYFPGDGLSSHYRTPGAIPMTAYRYNVVGDQITCSVVEGETIELPKDVADHVSRITDPTWPETFWAPRGMSSFEYMSRIGPNHDANSFGLIGADILTFNAMLRIPVDMHNVPSDQIFRPTLWDRFGGDDFRACEKLGPLYQ
ncbi:MAG: L-fucose isomerase [Verrucomicrobia bacterium]|nr:L-fucose isomerase [Verrucomicrobiota bacterium]MCG2678813.1 L-fucose isomerase [Kiritimatiellia bacterium]MBU4248673.1 L-fucose isomerase [Verrucomicrobiota bacterium]MBU4289698.1 L-fucose isomerase [Verrucomicrobiota bacterium]MBU4429330.1 L-fucose isomerase [Verrucomicrobiota bacterium]